jgi:hypothetical protein
MRREGGEVWLAHEHFLKPGEYDGAGHPSPPPEPPEGVGWSRWATPDRSGDVALLPALPDRTVVLKPERSFRLMNGAGARVFVRVPLWIRVELVLGQTERVLLEEIPSLVMSDTWWGDFIEGELAYWLPTTARREMRPELHRLHLAACPLQLLNRSGTDLNVEKLALRVPHLSLFVHGGHFWADEARVTYQGDAEGSHIEMTGRSPAEAPGGIPVASPRRPVHRGLRARTFDRLRLLSGIGGMNS